MPYNDVLDALSLAAEQDEIISIGGGEPTLHPRFFDILKHALWKFEYVWLATNGSKTKTMYRLDNIIQNCDYESDVDEYDMIQLSHDDQLSVALSQDCFHNPINPRIVELWKRRKYEIRNTSNSIDGITRQGRAKRTNVGWNENSCVCSDIIIKWNGNVHLCGCEKSPQIGTIRSGVEEKWQRWMRINTKYNDTRCAFGK